MNAENENEILRQLRDTPQLFADIRSAVGSELNIQQSLRSSYPAELTRAAMALDLARQQAKELLPDAEDLWLTRVALQQSTSWLVAQHKAGRFPAGETVMDLCSGIGVDSAALLNRGPVTAVDIDPAMSTRCEWNLQIWRQRERISAAYEPQFTVNDVHKTEIANELLHIDPDRRVGRERPAKRLEHYTPNLEWLQQLTTSGHGGALKLGPASNFLQKFPGCETELISLNGECREATIWYGALAGESAYRATVLPSGESIAADPLSAWCPVADVVDTYVFDPDPAVVRSGLLDAVGEIHNLQRLDKSEEYFTGCQVPGTFFVTPYLVEACLPNNIRSVKKHLRKCPSSDYEIKCRHVRVDASVVQRQLPRGDEPTRTIIFMRIAGRAKIVVAKRIRPS